MTIQILQFILSLSLLVILHELGHFLPAIAFKTRVEKFYLFFDPWFSLVKKKIGGTEYGIGWLPLGGYVKIAGMVDESMDTEQMKQPAQPWEFRSKPAWQRLVILLGGVTVNFIVAIVIYAGMMAYYGDTYVSNDSLKDGVWVNDLGEELGLQTGDRITAVDGKEIARFNDVNIEILLGSGKEMTVVRGSESLQIPITAAFVKSAIENKTPWMFPRVPYYVKAFTEDSPAMAAGLELGDKITGLNGHAMPYFDQFLDSVPAHAGQAVTLQYEREGVAGEIAFTVSDSGRMGVYWQDDVANLFPLTTVKYSGFSAVTQGWHQATSKLSFYVRQVKLMFQPETGAYKEAGGFITIMQQYPTEWDWQRFWNFTAFLSLALGFLNVLPIPALDGGHAVFVLIEMVTGKAPSTKVLEVAQMIGFFLLLGLLLLVNGNDIVKLFS
jgi:regulator of sigma E protease